MVSENRWLQVILMVQVVPEIREILLPVILGTLEQGLYLGALLGIAFEELGCLCELKVSLAFSADPSRRLWVYL